jgi:hypothetical protein
MESFNRTILTINVNMNRQILKENLTKEFNIPCHDPPNGGIVVVKEQEHPVPVQISKSLLHNALKRLAPSEKPPYSNIPFRGALVINDQKVRCNVFSAMNEMKERCYL